MSKSGTLLLTLVEKQLRKKTWTVLPTHVKLLIASTRLADDVDAGILGAALVARRAYRGDIDEGNNSKVKNNDVDSVDGGNERPEISSAKISSSIASSLLLGALPWMGLITGMAIFLFTHRRNSHS